MKTYLVNLNKDEMTALVDAPELDNWHNGEKNRKAYITAKAKLLKILSTREKLRADQREE